MTLSEFVSRELSEITNNHMCRMIAGVHPDAGFSINGQWLLDLALHNLKRHYVLVGTVERLDDFVCRLAHVSIGRQLSSPK